MTIDWITVSAQIVNFLILVWVLKRLLYQPVLRAMATREQHIRAELDEAARRELAADAAAASHHDAQHRLEAERECVLSEARAAAEEDRKRLHQEARAELAQLRARWHKQVDAEKAEFLVRLRRQAMEAVEAMARKSLSDLADVRLEEQIVAVFEARLEAMDAATRAALTQATGPLELVTAFEPEPGSRERIEKSVRKALGQEPEIHFRRSAELICGIQLTVGGLKVGWNLDEYTELLTERVQAVLSPSSEPARSR